jgi:glycosyltransferase involved in cell wall biosynthesis
MTDTTVQISFAVTTKNEGEYVANLLNQLVPFCIETGDEIVILDDYSTDEYTLSILDAYDSVDNSNFLKVYKHSLNNDFAAHKNYLNDKCSGDYIFQIDADETLHPNLLKYLHDILGYNADIDLFMIPRVNIVNGLTDEDIAKWGWSINNLGWVMFPDLQTRLYRNVEHIKWHGKVHERIVGYKTHTSLPQEEEWSLYHIKDIERQRKQNQLYASLQV